MSTAKQKRNTIFGNNYSFKIKMEKSVYKLEPTKSGLFQEVEHALYLKDCVKKIGKYRKEEYG